MEKLFEYTISVDANAYGRNDVIQIDWVQKFNTVRETPKTYVYEFKASEIRKGKVREAAELAWQKEHGFKPDQPGWHEYDCYGQADSVKKSDINRFMIDSCHGMRVNFQMYYYTDTEYSDEEMLEMVKKYLRTYFDNMLANIVIR